MTLRKTSLVICLLLFVAAFLLRVSGLSHDLDLGNVYHPDTPKQMWAADEFSQGRYFHTTGYHDLDGYPFFTSLIVSKINLMLTFVYDHTQTLIGNPGRHFDQIPNRLFWITRLLNVTLSSLAVVLLFLIARQFYGNGVAIPAAVLLTISPVDISACHYATGDTPAAFFALLALFFSIRIYLTGKWYHYLLAAFFVICSFSAKYHGALAVIPLMLAHILRCKSPRELFSRQSVILTSLTAATAIAAFFITTAGAWQHPVKTINQIIGFMHYTANFHLSPEVAAMSLPQRFLYSMRVNLPVFADILGPILFGLSVAGLLSPLWHRRKQEWLITSLPLVYILWGLTSKPASYPVYHTIVIPQMILMASLVLARLYASRKLRPLPQISAAGAILISLLYLANYSARQLFFFNQRDTRVLAKEWVADNIPATYRVLGTRYSNIADDADLRPGPFDGIAWIRCDIREKPAPGDPLLATIDTEHQQMLFRNFPAEIYLAQQGQLRDNHTMPLFNWVPSSAKTRLILARQNGFFRNPHLFTVEDYDKREIFSTNRLESILVVVTPLPRDTRVKVRVANRKKVWHLKWNRPGWTMLDGLRPNLPLLRGGYHYHVEVHTGKNRPAQIALGITPLEKAVLFFQLGEFARSEKWLSKIPATYRNPTLREMAATCRRKIAAGQPSGPPPQLPVASNLTAKAMLRDYGIAADFLAAIPYIKIAPGDIRYGNDMRLMHDDLAPDDTIIAPPIYATNATHTISTGFLALPAGNYTLTLNCRPIHPSAKYPATYPLCRMLDNSGNLVGQAQNKAFRFDNPACYTNLTFRLKKPPLPPAVRFEVELPGAIAVSAINIAVDFPPGPK